MQNHIAFPSITQFKDVVKNIRKTSQYFEVPLPTIKFVGTVKLHGTNHGVCRPLNGGTFDIYTQSRERITTPESDNAGSAIWTYANLDTFQEMFESIRSHYFSNNDAYLDDNSKKVIQIFGEFCGGSIQKGIGLNNLPKMFVVFGIRVSQDSESNIWFTQAQIEKIVSPYISDTLHHIYEFPTYQIDVDFSNPEKSQNEMVELTNSVEKDCPVSRQLLGQDFDKELIGEGIVWTAVESSIPQIRIDGLRYKVKGERHAATKCKTLAEVDVQKVNSVSEFVQNTLTTNRLEQGLSKLTEMGLEHNSKSTGDFIKFCVSDIIKEELDMLVESGLTTKDVTSKIASCARDWYLKRI